MLRAYRRPLPFLLGLLVLPLICVGVAIYDINVPVWRAQSLHNLGVTARLGAEILDETLNESVRFAANLADDPGLVDAIRRNDAAQLTERLRHALSFASHLDLAMVLSPEGVVLGSTDEAEGVGRDLRDSEAFGQARSHQWRPTISAVYYQDTPRPEKLVSVIVPITSRETVVGLLLVQHRVETIKSWMQKLRVEPDGFLYVVDHRDQLVVYPFQVLTGRPKTVSLWPPVAAPAPPEGATLSFDNAKDGRRWLAAVHPVGDTGWRVVAVQPETAALGTLYRIFWALGGLGLLLLGLTTLTILRWVNTHNLSLHLLRQNAKLLKHVQQQRTIDRGKDKGAP